MKTSLARFRIIAYTEAVSFLLLLGIAMPLKYLGGMPEAVKITGWVHGILFMLYIFSLTDCAMQYKWTLKKNLLFFAASLLPFGPFIADAKMLKNEKVS